MKSTREEVYSAISAEREYQQTKWGNDQQSTGAFLTMIREYSRQADYAWTTNEGDTAGLDIIRKIAALAVACMEQNGTILRK